MPGRAIGVQWFSIDKEAHTIGVGLDLPELIRPETTLARAGQAGRSRARARRRASSSPPSMSASSISPITRRRPRTSYYLRPAQALGGGPRSLRPADRRHAGHQGPDPDRRRFRGEGALQGSPPVQPPLALVFGHRHGRTGRHGGSQLRYPGLLRHGAGDGGCLERRTSRPCVGRCRGARPCGGHGHLAALPARPATSPRSRPRPRQCRGGNRRLHDCGRPPTEPLEHRRRRKDPDASTPRSAAP